MNYAPDRKAISGLDHEFAWRARDGYPSSAPSLRVRWPSGTSTYALTVIRSADTVSALSDDGRDLTIATGPTQPGHTLRGIIAEFGGHAWLDGGADHQGPVLVTGIVSQTSLAAATTGTAVLRLAETLPGGLAIVSQLSSASGSIVVGAGAAASARSVGLTVAGRTFEFDELGGAAPGYAGNLIDREASPGVRCTDAVLATRLAACINAAALGVTATAVGTTVTLTAGRNVTVTKDGDGAALYTCTNLTGATPSWRLRWLSYTATIPAADLGATIPLRQRLWSIDWTRKVGDDLPTRAVHDQGWISVVACPFSTGLDDEQLYALVPALATLVPQRQSSWAAQRDAAEAALVAILRPLVGADHDVDDLYGPQLARAHALLTVAEWLASQTAVGIDRNALADFRQQGSEEITRVMARPQWLDDGDGVVGAGETGVAKSGLTPWLVTAATSTAQDVAGTYPARIEYGDDR